MNKQLLYYLLLSTALSAAAQLILKAGMKIYGTINFGLDMILAVFQPLVFIGLLTYFISAIFWITAISKTEVSYAYPFASLGYVMVAIIGLIFMNETVNITRWIGIIVIILGVYIVGKSAKKKK